MKKSKLLKLLSVAMLFIAAMGFASCVDDNDDLGMPYLEVTPQVLKFDANGTAIGASEFMVKSNRPWSLDIPDDAPWVRPSVTSGEGDGSVSFNLFANQQGRSAKLTFSLKNSAGFAYASQDVYIQQGEVVPEEVIFNETFGNTAVANPWPTVADYKGWQTTGEGIKDVTFSGTNTSIRNSGKSSSGAYDGASGPNVLFFGAAPATFTVNNITLNADQTNLKITFGGQFYDGSSNDFQKDNMILSISGDGTNFVPLDYTVNNGDQADPFWVLATKDFTLAKAVTNFWIRLEAINVSSAFRVDDVRLVTGNGGEVIDLGEVKVAVTTSRPTGVTATEATLAGSVNTLDGVSAVGFQYTENMADIDWSAVAKTPADAVAAQFTKAISGLTAGTTYAARAYATTTDGDVYGSVVTFTPSAGPSGDEIVTDFTGEAVWPAGFPASSGDKKMGPETYTFGDATYTLAGGGTGNGFYRGKEYQGTRYYLMIGKQDAYIELPAMEGKALTSVECFVPGAASANVMVGISTVDGVDVSGGAPIKWEYQEGGSSTNLVDRTYTYTLSGTQPNTKYRLYIASAYNAQIYKLTLKYGQGGGGDPTVTTGAATNITASSATLAGSSSNVSGASEVGVEYVVSTTPVDWTSAKKAKATAASSSWTVNVDQLTAATKYAYRAYAIAGGQTYYGSEAGFITKNNSSGDDITVDFTSESAWPAGFPASSGSKLMGPESYAFGGETFTLAGGGTGNGYYRGKEYQGTRYYLMIGKQDAYIELPAVAGKALTKVECFVPGAASANVMVGVSTVDGVDVAGGAPIKWDYQEGGSSTNLVDRTYTYTLSGTQANTKYRLYIASAYNAQLYTLTLSYGQGGGDPQPKLTPATASMAFTAEADATGKTQVYQLIDATGLQLFAEVADATNFSAAVENDNTVRVKALNANTGTAARTTTVTAYLAAAKDGDRKATATINVTQAAPSGGPVAITIPALNEKIAPNTNKVVLDADNDYVFEAVVMNDVQGGNYSFNNLILATELATAQGNGVTLYGSQVEPTVLGLDRGDKVKVTLYKGLAQIQNYQGMYEITGDQGVDWCKVEKIGFASVIQFATITPPQLAAYQGMAVRILNATTSAPGVWAVADNISSHTLSADGSDLTVFCKKDAKAFVDMPYAAATGTIYGLAAVNKNAGQLVPRDMSDVEAFNPTAPVITSLDPDALNWGSADVYPQAITAKGSGLTGNLSATLSGGADSKFTINMQGTMVTVTPKGENTTAADFVETLTVTAAGGNSMTATLTQKKPSSGAAKWVKVTSAPADWSGDYLIVYEAENLVFDGSLTVLDAVEDTKPVTISNGEIESNAETDACKFTVASISGGYSIKSASGYFIYQTSDANGLKSSTTTTGLNTLALNSDGSVQVTSSKAVLRYNATSGQDRFRYYKSASYTAQKPIALYKYTE